MIQFGPSGNSESFYAAGLSHTEEAAAFVKARGLDCFEYSFGRGVRIKKETAEAIGKAFQKEGVEISVHAPYFVNLGSPEAEKGENSYGYIIESGMALKWFGGKRCVFHPAAQGKENRSVVIARTKDRMKVLRDRIYEAELSDLLFCPETMGKLAQIGTIEEITDFCTVDPVFVPCVDFGHVNAREQGSLKTYADYKRRLEYMIGVLGYERMKNFHVHFSKIAYTAKGEVKHLTFADTAYGPEFAPLAEALWDLHLEPYIVCESDGTQAEDAKTMKEIFASLRK